MVARRAPPYLSIMQATLTSPSGLSPSSSSSSSDAAPSAASRAPRAWPAALVLAFFLPFSLWVLYADGLMGLLRVVRNEPWGAQMFFDVYIACFIGGTWMVRDARQRGIPAWPFVVATLSSGSIGLLGYYVYRALRGRPAA